MKCPFRTNEKGEYMNCYGPNCMAYLEYEFPSHTSSVNTNSLVETKTIIGCRKFQQQQYIPFQSAVNVPYYGGFGCSDS